MPPDKTKKHPALAVEFGDQSASRRVELKTTPAKERLQNAFNALL